VSLKSVILSCSLFSTLGGLVIITFVLYAALGFTEDRFSPAFHPFIAFFGGYLVFIAVALRRDFSPRRVHQYFSAVFVALGVVAVLAILGPEKNTTWMKALFALVVFLLIGGIYKLLLAAAGKSLFGREIKE
jgi:peptidoglycan/LPS O-acetylase OafA/YrhL